MDSKILNRTFGVVFALGIATQAHAIPQLRLQSSAGGDVTVADGGAADLNATSGVILFSGAVAGWDLNITSGFSKPFIGSPLGPWLDLASANFTSWSGGSLNIWLTDTDFGPHSDAAHILAAIGGTTSGSVTFKAFYDDSNTAFGTTHELTSQTFSPDVLAFAGEADAQLSSTKPYSLTMLVTLVHEGFEMTSFDATVKVPEPSSLLLLSLGLVGIGGVVRRRSAVSAL